NLRSVLHVPLSVELLHRIECSSDGHETAKKNLLGIVKILHLLAGRRIDALIIVKELCWVCHDVSSGVARPKWGPWAPLGQIDIREGHSEEIVPVLVLSAY